MNTPDEQRFQADEQRFQVTDITAQPSTAHEIVDHRREIELT